VPQGHGELTTPTGAAILAAVVDRFGPLPPMRLRAVGYGAGTRELPDRANVLRVTLGELVGEPDVAPATDVLLIEANVDDMSPQLVGPLFEALFEAGAVDAWSTPILMKKGRPAIQISALAPATTGAAVERAFFAASTTLGLRRRALDRVVLARSFAKVATPYGSVRVKVAALDGEVLGAQPEFEDCRRLAARARVSAREVLSAAAAAARQLLPRPARSRRT
jgi:pyridinium-3,5-bisthiocarboxylic acid mononucleotide nickel chelatase